MKRMLSLHILLPNDEVYSLAREGHDVFTMSQIMGTDVNLMLIKMQEMNKLGYDFNISMQHDSRFFTCTCRRTFL